MALEFGQRRSRDQQRTERTDEQKPADPRLTPDPARVAELGEVFTPSWLVRDILDLVPDCELEETEATCLDPACGHGQFLLEALRRKLDAVTRPNMAPDPYRDASIAALTRIYGVDIDEGNVADARRRMNEYLAKAHKEALWDREHDGDCLVVPEGDTNRAILRRLDAWDVLIRNSCSEGVLEKVWARMERDSLAPLDTTVWGSNAFGIRAHLVPTSATKEATSENTVLLMTRDGDRYIGCHQVGRNPQALGLWKVVISKRTNEHAGNPGPSGRKQVLTNRARVLPANSACTETYLLLGCFADEQTAHAFFVYLRTKFFRFLLQLRIAAQDIVAGCFAFVPTMPTDRIWTDEELNAHFGLDEEEVAHIERLIKEMPG